MALSIVSNYAANVANRYLTKADQAASASLAKLSAGTRVLAAKDDAASLAIGARLNAEVQAQRQAKVNAGQATSMLQIADGAMSKVNDLLVRMKTLAVQAGSGQLSGTERGMLNTEYQALLTEVDRIAAVTKFNGVSLVNDASTTDVSLVGLNSLSRIDAAHGFAAIALDSGVGDAQIHVTYDIFSNILKLTDLTSGVSQGIDVGNAAIPAGQTQQVRFNSLGATVTLNSGFDKSVSIGAANGLTLAGGGAGAVNVATIEIDGANDAALSALGDAGAIALQLATPASATLSLTSAYGNFAATAPVDLTTLGAKSVTMADGASQFTLRFTVTTGFAADAGGGTLDLDGFATTIIASAVNADRSDFSFKLGSGATANVDDVTVSVGAVSANALGINGGAIATKGEADTASAAISTAIDRLNTARADIGAAQNRLEFAADNLATTIENGEAARSSLMDLDVAAEMTAFTAKQVLVQSGVAMLAQANQMPQNLLKLFQ
ncbi:MAG TPA: flagellin [Alphaproteobacteria bacterium]|nr:flagellin [Alphaproteobacteria bacterium]